MPASLKALSLAALLCLPAAAFALYWAYGWFVVWDEDIGKTFMSETPGYHVPAIQRALAHIRAFPGLLLLTAPVVCGASIPIAVLSVALICRVVPVASLHPPGWLLSTFLILTSGGLMFIGIINQPFGLAFLPLAALSMAASFVSLVPRRTRESA